MGPVETAAAPLPGGGGGPADVTNITTARQLIARCDKLDASNAGVGEYARWISDAYRFLTEMTRDA